MTLGFGEIVPIVFLNLENWTEGTNGIGGIFRPEPLPVIGAFSALTPFAYFIADGLHHHDRHDAAVPAPGFPDRASLERHPRG